MWKSLKNLKKNMKTWIFDVKKYENEDFCYKKCENEDFLSFSM
jgi:hypothetical protein